MNKSERKSATNISASLRSPQTSKMNRSEQKQGKMMSAPLGSAEKDMNNEQI
jgi:hypothetical protein